MLAAALAVALSLTIAGEALAQAPGADQYKPSLPTAKGGKAPTNKPSTPSTGTSTQGQTTDQAPSAPSSGPTAAQKEKAKKAAAAKRARERREAARRKAKRQAAKDRAALAAVPAADSGGNDGDDDGTLTSVGNALTDWNDPVLPGLVVLVALLTLAASVTVLMRRRRDSRS